MLLTKIVLIFSGTFSVESRTFSLLFIKEQGIGWFNSLFLSVILTVTGRRRLLDYVLRTPLKYKLSVK